MGSKNMVGLNVVSAQAGARGKRLAHALFLLLAGCWGCDDAAARKVQPSKAAKPSPVDPSPAKAATPSSASTGEPTPKAEPFPCAELTCTQFGSPVDATLAAIAPSVRVVGFGEAHARADSSGPTTARRFSEELLAGLAPRARHLLVELLVPPTGCEKARKEVQLESDTITKGQSEHNQNDYVELGHAARKRGVTPDILRPSCQEMQTIAKAEVGVISMMETIANLSVKTTEGWLGEPPEGRPLILLYGGALHNDVEPRPHVKSWSYGPRLSALSHGAYVELDLVVPELVQDTESWQKFHWYKAVRALPETHGATLVRVSDQSFALVFARQPK